MSGYGYKCMVLFCKHRGPMPGITYFRLTAGRHDAWLRALGRDPAKEHLCDANRICSVHFLPEDLTEQNGKLILKPGSLPKRNLDFRRPLLQKTKLDKDNSASKAGPSKINPEEDKCTPSITSGSPYPVEEKVIYQDLQICLENKENKHSLETYKLHTSSFPSESTLTANSQEAAFDVCDILKIIFILLGIFLLCLKKREPEIPKSLELKRKLSCSSSTSTESEGYKGPVKKARKNIGIFHN